MRDTPTRGTPMRVTSLITSYPPCNRTIIMNMMLSWMTVIVDMPREVHKKFEYPIIDLENSHS